MYIKEKKNIIGNKDIM